MGRTIRQQGAIVPTEMAIGARLVLPGVAPIRSGADDRRGRVSDRGFPGHRLCPVARENHLSAEAVTIHQPDRLKFLQGLSVILFDYEAKERLKERTQLHKILESNTWIFGEEFNLWASDRELTTVLKAHKEKLDPDLVIDEPVKLLIRKRGIVDLMLSRAQKRHRSNDYEHLVVELKAPKVKLTAKELTQIKDYALSVARDPRFHRVDGVRWHFWLVSNEVRRIRRIRD
jgi:hypothetical protein